MQGDVSDIAADAATDEVAPGRSRVEELSSEVDELESDLAEAKSEVERLTALQAHDRPVRDEIYRNIDRLFDEHNDQERRLREVEGRLGM